MVIKLFNYLIYMMQCLEKITQDVVSEVKALPRMQYLLRVILLTAIAMIWNKV